jgi:hypothetical protein
MTSLEAFGSRVVKPLIANGDKDPQTLLRQLREPITVKKAPRLSFAWPKATDVMVPESLSSEVAFPYFVYKFSFSSPPSHTEYIYHTSTLSLFASVLSSTQFLLLTKGPSRHSFSVRKVSTWHYTTLSCRQLFALCPSSR